MQCRQCTWRPISNPHSNMSAEISDLISQESRRSSKPRTGRFGDSSSLLFSLLDRQLDSDDGVHHRPAEPPRRSDSAVSEHRTAVPVLHCQQDFQEPQLSAAAGSSAENSTSAGLLSCNKGVSGVEQICRLGHRRYFKVKHRRV